MARIRASHYAVVVSLAFLLPVSALGQVFRAAPVVEPADVDRWMSELSNWGRWGPEDELGTLNFLTPSVRAAAFDLVTDGLVVSLSRALSSDTTVDNTRPLDHSVSRFDAFQGDLGAAGDTYSIWYHGYAHTHVDALSHLFYKGQLYNGFDSELVKERGAEKLGVATMSRGITTRGILVDVPSLLDVPYLEPGHAIMAEDLEAWEQRVGLRVGTGDALIIRTGRWARRAAVGAWRPNEFAGLHASAVRWLKERDVAVLGGDAASDVMPSGVEGLTLPVHQLTIVALGMPLLDNLDLEGLARAAARRNQYEFLLLVLPLNATGGIGSPVNPVAVF